MPLRHPRVLSRVGNTLDLSSSSLRHRPSMVSQAGEDHSPPRKSLHHGGQHGTFPPLCQRAERSDRPFPWRHRQPGETHKAIYHRRVPLPGRQGNHYRRLVCPHVKATLRQATFTGILRQRPEGEAFLRTGGRFLVLQGSILRHARARSRGHQRYPIR